MMEKADVELISPRDISSNASRAILLEGSMQRQDQDQERERERERYWTFNIRLMLWFNPRVTGVHSAN